MHTFIRGAEWHLFSKSSFYEFHTFIYIHTLAKTSGQSKVLDEKNAKKKKKRNNLFHSWFYLDEKKSRVVITCNGYQQKKKSPLTGVKIWRGWGTHPSIHKIHLLNLFFFSELRFISQHRAPLIDLEMLMGNICGPSPKLEMHFFRTGAATEMRCTWFCDRSRNTVSLTI